eukprot:EG_transcript_21385
MWKWELCYTIIVATSLFALGIVMVSQTGLHFGQPQLTAHFAQGVRVMPSTTLTVPLRAVPREPSRLFASTSGANNFPQGEEMPTAHTQSGASSTLIAWEAALAVLISLALRPKRQQMQCTMLAMGAQDVDEAEILLQATPQDATLTVEQTVVPDAAGKTSKAVFLLPVLFTAFILQAYYFGSPVPDLLPRQLWLLLHCVGGMLFGGLVFSSTLYEALVILQGDPQVRRWWFERVPMVDGKAMLPFLGVTVVSGVCLAQLTYQSLQTSPPFVSLTLETLMLFGVMWGSLDHSTQGPAKA